MMKKATTTVDQPIMYIPVLHLAAALLLGVQVQARDGWHYPIMKPPTTTIAPGPSGPHGFVTCAYNTIQSVLKKNHCLAIPKEVDNLFYHTVDDIEKDIKALIENTLIPLRDCFKGGFMSCISAFAKIPMSMLDALHSVLGHATELNTILVKIAEHTGDCLRGAEEFPSVIKEVWKCFW